MKQTEKILTVLEPPPGGLMRLRARRDSAARSVSWSAHPWWALAAGAAAAFAWVTLASNHTDLQLQFTGARLIGERSQGAGVQMLGDQRAVALPSADDNVRLYWLEPKPPI